MEHEEGAQPGQEVSRRQLIKRGAVVGSAAIWVPPLIQSIRVPAHAQVGSPAPCIVDGFMTGGGFIYMNPDNTGPKVNYQLTDPLHCTPTPSDNFKVTWTTGTGPNKVTYEFVLTSHTHQCSINPGFPIGPGANFNEISGSGTGTLKITGQADDPNASVTYDFIDGGEPGISNDRTTLIIVGTSAGQVLNLVDQPIDGGNQQAHDGNFAFGNACNF